MKRVLIIFAIACVISLGVGTYMYFLPVKSLKKAKPVASLTASELLAAFEDNEDASNTLYLDNVLEVSGTIASIDNEPDQPVQIVLDAGSLLGGVSCVMEPGTTPEGGAEGCIGKNATIKGSCTGYLMEVILDRCVVVSINE